MRFGEEKTEKTASVIAAAFSVTWSSGSFWPLLRDKSGKKRRANVYLLKTTAVLIALVFLICAFLLKIYFLNYLLAIPKVFK